MLTNFLPSVLCACVCVCVRVYVYIYIYIYMCVYIYVYIYIYIHTHTRHFVLPEGGQVGRDTSQRIINSENDKKVES
jgi:hypothetical protein